MHRDYKRCKRRVRVRCFCEKHRRQLLSVSYEIRACDYGRHAWIDRIINKQRRRTTRDRGIQLCIASQRTRPMRPIHRRPFDAEQSFPRWFNVPRLVSYRLKLIRRSQLIIEISRSRLRCEIGTLGFLQWSIEFFDKKIEEESLFFLFTLWISMLDYFITINKTNSRFTLTEFYNLIASTI